MPNRKPWKFHLNARTCKWCGSQRPGMQPLRLFSKGKMERGFFEKARVEARKTFR